MVRAFMLLIILMSVIIPALADDDMSSGLICPCECAMVMSTCDCPTAIQVKKEIFHMKENGFSEKQIISALQAEYGKGILAYPEKNSSMLLWMGGTSLVIISVVLGYIFTRKRNLIVIPDKIKYEQKFEEEYQKFVFESEALSKDFLKESPKQGGKS